MENEAMLQEFTWEPNPMRGEWLRSMEAEPLGSILSIVPRGFEAYARVFHPVERDRPRSTNTWRGLDQATCFDGVPDIAAALETERASWAAAATSFGTIMHAEAQYARLVRRDYGDTDGVMSADGWRYGATSEGCLDVLSLAVVSDVLARHTSTPGTGIAAIWEGWGGLVSSAGMAYLVAESNDDGPGHREAEVGIRSADPSLVQQLAEAARQAMTSREPEPGSGVLAREVAVGPRFDLHGDTGRRYFLFAAGAEDFADAEWPARAPWVRSRSSWAPSPSILWPKDHAWVLATEIDFDSTLVAGSASLIRDLVQTPGIEVFPIRTDADLTWDGDAPNRPASSSVLS